MPQHNKPFEPCFNRIFQKRKNNLRNIVHTDFLTLCGLKPGTTSAKTKPKKKKNQFSSGLKQALKQAAMYDRSQEITGVTRKTSKPLLQDKFIKTTRSLFSAKQEM